MTAKENIENLYQVFKAYNLNGPIDKCNCGCISGEDEQKIYAKPLKELEADDIGYYNGKAMTTWGNVDNYKHFLPRIIEIYKEDKANGWIDLDTIHNKLKHANWTTWKEEEQAAINKFIEIDWKALVNKTQEYIGIEEFEAYLNYLDFEAMLGMWAFPEDKVSLRNFVEFFYLNGNDIFYTGKKIKIKGEDRQRQLADLSKRDNLQESLEEAFFSSENSDKEYANKVSTVLQMIESEINK